MTTKLFFALGKGGLTEIRYALDGDSSQCAEAPTRYAAIATADLFSRFVRPDLQIEQAIPLLTKDPDVQATWEGARKWFCEKDIRTDQVCSIPDKATLQDFAEIVANIAALVDDGDRLVFDLTNGLRYIPVMMLLSIAFVRTVRKDVELCFAGYGALELQDKGVAPLVDVSDALRMIDWVQALQRFQHLWDAQPLVRMLDEARTRCQLADDREGEKKLKAVRGALSDFQTAWTMWQLNQASEAARQLSKHLSGFIPMGEGLLGGSADLYALAQLRTTLQTTLTPWLANPNAPDEPDSLRAYAWLAPWLIERGQWVRAIALLQELIVAAFSQSGDTDPRKTHQRTWKLLKLYDRLTPLRNSVLHGGCSLEAGPPDAKALEQTLKNVIGGLQTLGIVPQATDRTTPPGQRVAVCSTLGTGRHDKDNPKVPKRYIPVNYTWTGGATPTRFPTIASLEYAGHTLKHPVPPEGRLLVTDKAKAGPMYGEILVRWAACVGNELQSGDVGGKGRREDVSSAFNAVWDWLQDGDRVVLDFTHALRSISVGMVAAAILARATRANLEIAMVCYGVEPPQNLKDGAKAQGRLPDSPLLDITPMMDLLKWAEAADAFLHGADSSLLTRRLRKTEQPALLQLADTFDAFTLATATFRYTAALETARTLQQQLNTLLPAGAEPEQWSEASKKVPAFRVVGEVLKQAVSELQAGDHGLAMEARYEDRIAAMERVALWLTARDAGAASLGVRSELLALRLARPLGLFPPGKQLVQETDLAVVAFVANTLSKVIAKREADKRKGKNEPTPIHPYAWVYAIASDPLRAHLEALDAEQAISRLEAAIASDAEVQGDYRQSEKIAHIRNHLLHAGWAPGSDSTSKACKLAEKVEKVIEGNWGLQKAQPAGIA